MGKADEDCITPLPEVPPEWVSGGDIPRWLAVMSRVSTTTVAPETLSCLWTGELRFLHRIVGVEPHFVDGYYGGPKIWPPGLSSTDEPLMDGRWDNNPFSFRDEIQVVATNWTAADCDRRTFTVGGWPDMDGARPRHLIEWPWALVWRWAGQHVKRWKMQEETSTSAQRF